LSGLPFSPSFKVPDFIPLSLGTLKHARLLLSAGDGFERLQTLTIPTPPSSSPVLVVTAQWIRKLFFPFSHSLFSSHFMRSRAGERFSPTTYFRFLFNFGPFPCRRASPSLREPPPLVMRPTGIDITWRPPYYTCL